MTIRFVEQTMVETCDACGFEIARGDDECEKTPTARLALHIGIAPQFSHQLCRHCVAAATKLVDEFVATAGSRFP